MLLALGKGASFLRPAPMGCGLIRSDTVHATRLVRAGSISLAARAMVTRLLTPSVFGMCWYRRPPIRAWRLEEFLLRNCIGSAERQRFQHQAEGLNRMLDHAESGRDA